MDITDYPTKKRMNLICSFMNGLKSQKMNLNGVIDSCMQLSPPVIHCLTRKVLFQFLKIRKLHCLMQNPIVIVVLLPIGALLVCVKMYRVRILFLDVVLYLHMTVTVDVAESDNSIYNHSQMLIGS